MEYMLLMLNLFGLISDPNALNLVQHWNPAFKTIRRRIEKQYFNIRLLSISVHEGGCD